MPGTPHPAEPVTAQLHRRATAARRLATADPWPSTNPPRALTARQLDAWATAAHHLTGLGLPPLLPDEVARALWQRGGPDRVLIERLDQNGGRAA